jgi:hypothetical protein
MKEAIVQWLCLTRVHSMKNFTEAEVLKMKNVDFAF